MRWFERNRAAMGPPGLFAEEYDVVQRQLRGNLPQAFVHALLLETAHRLGRAGVTPRLQHARVRRANRPTPISNQEEPYDIKKSPRVVVITGASGGIGRASARLFARRATTSPCSPAAAPASRQPPARSATSAGTP